MIKVALVSHTPAFAGAERMLFNLAEILNKEKDFEPVVLLPGAADESSPFFLACKDTGLPCLWIGPNNGYQTWYIYDAKGSAGTEKKQTILRAVGELETLLLRIKPDLVIGNTATNLVAALAAGRLQIPFMTWIHGICDNTYLPANSDAEQRLLYDRTLIALSSLSICCSEWTRRFYDQQFLGKAQTVYNWSPELDKLSSQEELDCSEVDSDKTKVFVCLNAYDEHKGIMTLLEAAELLQKSEECPDYHVELYGDGAPASKDKIHAFIESHGLAERVTMCRRTTNINAVYERAFCLVQPSHLEPFGMTIIEAMSKNRPVIATHSGGPDEILDDGVTGYLIDPNDAEALAEKMRCLLDHPETAAELGRRGRQCYEDRFSEKAAQRAILPLLEQAVREYSGFDPYQQLIFDMTMHQLTTAAPTPVYDPALMPGSRLMVPYDPLALCFSGVMKKKRKYNVSGQEGTLSAIGVLMSNTEKPTPNGVMKMRIYQEGKLLAESVLQEEELCMTDWTVFSFPTVQISAAPLTLEFCPENCKGVGVFEVKERRGFVYKVFNKLGMPLKGMDVLMTVLLP